MTMEGSYFLNVNRNTDPGYCLLTYPLIRILTPVLLMMCLTYYNISSMVSHHNPKR